MATPRRRNTRGQFISGSVPPEIQAAVAGLRFANTIYSFNFEPSAGILARDVDRLGMELASGFMEPLGKSIKNVVIPSIKKNFEVGGRPAWPTLAPYTIIRRGFDAWPILVRSGALKKAATSFGIWTITPNAASVQNLPQNVWYGRIHQAGYGSAATPRGASKAAVKAAIKRQTSRAAAKVAIPARPFVMFQEEDVPKIQAIFLVWLDEKAREFGRFG